MDSLDPSGFGLQHHTHCGPKALQARLAGAPKPLACGALCQLAGADLRNKKGSTAAKGTQEYPKGSK